jgi:sarcosine oxidase delta subunit
MTKIPFKFAIDDYVYIKDNNIRICGHLCKHFRGHVRALLFVKDAHTKQKVKQVKIVGIQKAQYTLTVKEDDSYQI